MAGYSWVFLRLSPILLLHRALLYHPITWDTVHPPPQHWGVDRDPANTCSVCTLSLAAACLNISEHQRRLNYHLKRENPAALLFSSLLILALTPLHTPLLLRKLGVGCQMDRGVGRPVPSGTQDHWNTERIVPPGLGFSTAPCVTIFMSEYPFGILTEAVPGLRDFGSRGIENVLFQCLMIVDGNLFNKTLRIPSCLLFIHPFFGIGF